MAQRGTHEVVKNWLHLDFHFCVEILPEIGACQILEAHPEEGKQLQRKIRFALFRDCPIKRAFFFITHAKQRSLAFDQEWVRLHPYHFEDSLNDLFCQILNRKVPLLLRELAIGVIFEFQPLLDNYPQKTGEFTGSLNWGHLAIELVLCVMTINHTCCRFEKLGRGPDQIRCHERQAVLHYMIHYAPNMECKAMALLDGLWS